MYESTKRSKWQGRENESVPSLIRCTQRCIDIGPASYTSFWSSHGRYVTCEWTLSEAGNISVLAMDWNDEMMANLIKFAAEHASLLAYPLVSDLITLSTQVQAVEMRMLAASGIVWSQQTAVSSSLDHSDINRVRRCLETISRSRDIAAGMGPVIDQLESCEEIMRSKAMPTWGDLSSHFADMTNLDSRTLRSKSMSLMKRADLVVIQAQIQMNLVGVLSLSTITRPVKIDARYLLHTWYEC
jgi:hypothetical protein